MERSLLCKGNNATFDGQIGHMEKGMVTTKHAMAFVHTPDYRVEGQDIQVYPGDKVVILSLIHI